MDLNKINFVNFPESEYHREITEKFQLIYHHTVSGGDALGDANYFKNKPGKIATHFIVGREGEIVQCFNGKYYGRHLGIKQSVFNMYQITNTNNLGLDKHSIGIELDSYGPLTMKDGQLYTAYNTKFVGEYVKYDRPFRGYTYYEKYTKNQLKAVKELSLHLCKTYNIPTKYQGGIFEINLRALKGEPGIWTHVSFRDDKSDCHPQVELLSMLSNL